MNNLDRLKFRFYHFEDKRIYDVCTFQKMPDEDCIRVFTSRPLPDGYNIENVKYQLTAEERMEANLVLNQKDGINGTLMQSTGLRDKNGKLIYEGDIISHYAFIDCVVYRNGVITANRNIADQSLCVHGLEEIEIIGNIYDNPELLSV